MCVHVYVCILWEMGVGGWKFIKSSLIRYHTEYRLEICERVSHDAIWEIQIVNGRGTTKPTQNIPNRTHVHGTSKWRVLLGVQLQDKKKKNKQ